MQLDSVSPEEMRRMLHLSTDRNKQYINSYLLFESVRTEVRKILGDVTFLPKSDKSVHQSKVNFWIFDRIFNGPWEYTQAPKTEDDWFEHEISMQKEVSPVRSKEKKPEPKQKVSFFDVYNRTKEILLTNVDSGLVANLFPDRDDGGVEDLREPDESDERMVRKMIVQKGVIDSWSPIIAIYGRAKQMLLINQAYCKTMNTDMEELDELIAKWRFQELFDSRDHEKLNGLIAKLSEGRGYKNEVLRAARTGRSIEWNSIGNPESGSLRIGRDVTHGERHSLNSKGMRGFHLHGEEYIAKIRQETLRRIDSINQRTFDTSEREELALKRISIDTKLRVLMTCASALDVFWKNGPFYMNVIMGERIYGNENYANLAGISGETSLDVLYNPEQMVNIRNKFEEGRLNGYYESEFTMQNKLGKDVTLAWHRFFPHPKKNDIGLNLSFGIGTTSITDMQNEYLKKATK